MQYDFGDVQGLRMFNVSIKIILTSKKNTKQKIIILLFVMLNTKVQQ